jgi:hypothetical protein
MASEMSETLICEKRISTDRDINYDFHKKETCISIAVDPLIESRNQTLLTFLIK